MPSPLSSPLAFEGGRRAPNRWWLAPLTNQQSLADGLLGDAELGWLERRAAGGFGVVETCAAHVLPEGQTWPGQLGIFSDALLPGLSRLASALARHGALGIVQLFHGGVRAPRRLTGEQPRSASAFTEETPEFETPRAMTEPEIERVIESFVQAAVRAERAGFAGVELHAAHGYLLGQFLSRSMNLRRDAWGRDAAGRARLLLEVVRGVRRRVSPAFVLGVRLSPEDAGAARGLDLDESLQVASWLADEGLQVLHLSLWDVARCTRKRPAEHPTPLFRAALPSRVRLVVAGSVWSREAAERQLELGADAVALGRAAIVHPDWPRRAEDPTWQPRRPPLTVAELAERAVSPVFAKYLERWEGFVAPSARA